MSDDNNEESASQGNRFARRKSKVQKEMETCMTHINETDFIVVACDVLPSRMGITDLFIKLVQSPDFMLEFGTFMKKGPFSERFFKIVIAPGLLAKVENAELEDALSAHLWARVFSKGRTVEYQENPERSAFHRLQGKYKDESALLATIRQDAFSMLEADECMPEFVSIFAQATLLTTSANIHYGFVPIVDSLKRQLAETICMNTAVNETLDTRHDVIELFIRNQLLQFSKTNHTNKGNEPAETKATLEITVPTSESEITATVRACTTMLKQIHAEIVGSHEAFVALKTAAAADIKISEETVTKTQLRHWVNAVLTRAGIKHKVKNSYDVVYCRVLNYLGMVYDFSVRGNFRYPIEIGGTDIEPRKYTKAQKARAAPKATDPQAIVEAFDHQLETLKNTTTDIENKKRTYLSNPAVQEYFKRQRMDGGADDDVMASLDDM